MNRNYYYLLIFLLSIYIVDNAFSADSTFIKSGFAATGNFSDRFYPPTPLYPNYGAFPQTSKIKTTVTGQGMIGRYFKDPISGITERGFEFPANRDINYLSYSGLWVGGIVGQDTLVSTAICTEYILYDQNTLSIKSINDFHPEYRDNDTATTILYNTENGEIFHTTFSDTFIPTYDQFSRYIDKHRPMGLHVTLKTYSKNIPPYKNIILLDFTITNKSLKQINSAYLGMYLNPFVIGSCVVDSIISDDLVGSFQNEGMVYVMDNDRELNLPNCQSGQASGTIALKTMTTYPPPIDTNFNWWTTWWGDGYGPRKKGTPEDPFRDIGYGEFGAPYGDSNRYYMMSHREWDYDQLFTKQTPTIDTSWIKFDDSISTRLSIGRSADYLLSLGPFEIPPDSSVRTIYAVIGAEFVHLSKYNYQNLLDEKYNDYYNNLYFDILFDNVRFAKFLTEEYLNPLNKPYGLRRKYLDSSSVFLTWDNYVFPEVFGYNVYIKEIPEGYLLTSTIVQPDFLFDDLPSELTLYTTEKNELTIENLQPGKIYAVVVAHASTTGEGILSDPIILGADNKLLKPAQVNIVQRFAPIHPEFKKTILRWNHPNNADISYYKIFKAKDSLSATTRYTPFLYSKPDSIPFLEQQCFDINDSIVCFYEWRAYDSVSNNLLMYVDSIVTEGQYYWITAVNNLGFESDFSPLIRSIQSPGITKDIVAIIGSPNSGQGYVYEDSVIQFYNELLQGYNYDIFMWDDSNLFSPNCTTSNCIRWEDLAKYKLVIINENPTPDILTQELESKTGLFSRLSDLGQNIAFFGTPTGNETVSLTSYTDSIYYDPNSFERSYIGLDFTNLKPWFGTYEFFDAIDSLAGFNAAIPVSTDLPLLKIKQNPSFFQPFIKQLFKFENYIPYVPVFSPTDESKVLYTYQSAYPETSEFHGKPVGIVKQNKSSQFSTFGFHLWAMELESSKKLIRYLFDKQSQYFPAYNIPNKVTLNQNYPNPFNATTVISFSLPRSYTVTVEVFNIIGQKIRTLLNPTMLSSGTHRINWDGKNQQNNDVSTGIYFYRLKIDDYSFTKKMVLLK